VGPCSLVEKSDVREISIVGCGAVESGRIVLTLGTYQLWDVAP